MGGSDSLWLDITNVGLGVAVAILVAAVMLAVALELLRKRRPAKGPRARAYNTGESRKHAA